MKEQLKSVESVGVDDTDKKIAKKRAKKKGVPEQETLLQREQEKNLQAAQQLVQEFQGKINILGWKLNSVLRFSPGGIAPTFELQPLSVQEMKMAKNRVKKDDVSGQLEKQKSKPERTNGENKNAAA